LKKLLISLMAVIVCAGMVGSSLAYFTDVETSTGNIITAGTLDLKITDRDEYPPRDGVSQTWSMSNMSPGVSNVGPWGVSLINTGTLAGDHVEISFSHEIIDTPDVSSDSNPNSVPGDLARWLQIMSMTYGNITFVGGLPTPLHTLVDGNGNGFIDLEDVTLPVNSAALDNLVVPELVNGIISFTMQLLFNAGATNDIQGDTLITTVYFTLNQVASL
jgi:spore coat-associated protein N